MKYLIIIPVKKNSSRLPNKNFLDFCGKPLYRWVLDEAERLCQNVFNVKEVEIVLLTDAFEDVLREMTKIKGYCPNTTVIKSPSWLSEDPEDRYQLASACLFAIKEQKRYGKKYENFILIQATNPLITAKDIKECINLFETKKRPIRTFTQYVDRLWHFEEKFYDKECTPAEMSIVQSCVGILIQKVESLISYKMDEAKFAQDVFPFFLSKEKAVDINDEIDFEYAKLLMQRRINKICMKN